MRDWLQATFIVKFYYLFLLLVVLWMATRVVILVRLLVAPLGQRLRFAQLLDDATPIEVAARAVLAGRVDGAVTTGLNVRVESIRARVAYLAATCEAAIWSIRGVLWLTLILSVLSVVADAVPALKGELYGTNRSGSLALYLWAERLTSRLSIGLLVSASLAFVSTVFEFILRRRRAEWELVSASYRINDQQAERSSLSETLR
jgi:hypothetical protein